MRPIFEKINKSEDQSFYLEEINQPYFTDLWHFHPEIEILYIKEGFGTKYVGDSFYPFSPGEVVIIGSDTPHVWSCNPDYLNPANNLKSSAICIQFAERFLGESILNLPEFYKINNLLNESKRGILFGKRASNMLINALEGLPKTIGVKRLIELLSILDIMSTSKDIRHLSSLNYKSVTIDSEDKDRIETISRYVIKNFPEKIFLDEIASLVHLTPQSFCRYFKSKTNKVFSTFVNEIRIGNACKMIIENKHSISQICYKSGFNYLSNFNRQFQRIKGLTPSEFQSKYMNHNFDQN